jgi:hypothetical protein
MCVGRAGINGFASWSSWIWLLNEVDKTMTSQIRPIVQTESLLHLSRSIERHALDEFDKTNGVRLDWNAMRNSTQCAHFLFGWSVIVIRTRAVSSFFMKTMLLQINIVYWTVSRVNWRGLLLLLSIVSVQVIWNS